VAGEEAGDAVGLHHRVGLAVLEGDVPVAHLSDLGLHGAEGASGARRRPRTWASGAFGTLRLSTVRSRRSASHLSTGRATSTAVSQCQWSPSPPSDTASAGRP